MANIPPQHDTVMPWHVSNNLYKSMSHDPLILHRHQPRQKMSTTGKLLLTSKVFPALLLSQLVTKLAAGHFVQLNACMPSGVRAALEEPAASVVSSCAAG